MKKAWIAKTDFTPLFVSDCGVRKAYLQKKWTVGNSSHIDVSPQERASLVETVMSWLSQTYPDVRKIYNRDNRHLSVYYLEQTALHGNLPSLSPSINDTVNFMIVGIFKEVYADRNKWLSSLRDLAVLFKDCQQVQYRAITETYKKVKNMGSLETRVSAVVDSWKYNWFRRLLTQHVSPHLEPHAESFYLAQFGDELGLTETEAATGDKLASHSGSDQSSISRLREILWDSVVNVQEVFDDVFNMFQGRGLTEDERVLCSAEMARFLEEHGMYSPHFYDTDSGYVTYNTTVKILLLLDVITHPDVDNEVWLNEAVPAAMPPSSAFCKQSAGGDDNGDDGGGDYVYEDDDDDQDFHYSDDGGEEEEMDEEDEEV